MKSLANRICKKPDESSLNPEISDLLQSLESSVKVMKAKNKVKDGVAEEMMDGREDNGAVTKKVAKLF